MKDSLSYVVKEIEPGVSEVEIALVGQKEEWLPQLEDLVNTEFNEGFAFQIMEEAEKLPDVITTPVAMTFEVGSRDTKPENVIKSLAEIPALLKPTKLPAIRLERDYNRIKHEVVLIGEIHIASKKESEGVSKIVPFFKVIGCEGVDVDDFIEGRIFSWLLMNVMSKVLNLFDLDKRSQSNPSSIDTALALSQNFKRDRQVFNLEKGWKPGIRARVFFVLFPLLFFGSLFYSLYNSARSITTEMDFSTLLILILTVAISLNINKVPIIKDVISFVLAPIVNHVFDLGPSRERNMVRNLLAVVEKQQEAERVLVLTGMAHTKPLAKLLCTKHGFIQVHFG